MLRTIAALCTIASFSALCSCAHAQSGNIFDKDYPIHGRAALQVVVDNSTVHAQSCGGCSSIHIHVDTRDTSLSEYRLEQSQNGNTVRLVLKPRNQHFWQGWHQRQTPIVTVNLPQDADANLQSENGDVTLSGINGNVDLTSENGNVSLTNVRGTLHTSTENGRITLTGVEGPLTAHTENGAISGDGRFAAIQAKSDNGSIRLTALDGSSLNGGIHVQTDNGSVDLGIPRQTHASVDLRTELGGIQCDLPLTSTSSGDNHHVQGTMNGGGPPLQVRTENGGVTVHAR